MKILYVEPFYGGSHKTWIESYIKYSKHTVQTLTLPGWNWKWRMHGGAITLADQLNRLDSIPDMIICSDMLNVPVFISLIRKQISNVPIVTYFHENQVAYPWSLVDADVKLNRDIHYFYINQTTALASDHNLFNSKYNLDSFLSGLEKDYLNKMPDNQNISSLSEIRDKSSIMYIGCELNINYSKNQFKRDNDSPTILWNHRWEFDKNPNLFFKTLSRIKDKGIPFNLVILGQSYRKMPDVFIEAKTKFRKEIIHYGYCDSYNDYIDWITKSDILPVTSNQDFFGISIVEAAYMETLPILPNRLSYPEIFDINKNKDIFYKSDNDLYSILSYFLMNMKETKKRAQEIAKPLSRFSWLTMANEYDNKLSSLYNQIRKV